MPETVFHGRTLFGWHEGGAFLLMRSEIDEPEIPSAVAVIGSDDDAETYWMVYFDERGVSRLYEVDMTDGTVTWHRNEAGFAQRNVITMSPDGSVLQGQGEMSRDGGPWEGDLNLTYERIGP